MTDNNALSTTIDNDETSAFAIALARRKQAIRYDSKEDRANAWKAKIDKIHVADATWKEAKLLFDDLIKNAANPELNGICMLIKGPSGAGKSHVLKRLMRTPSLQPSCDACGPMQPLLYVETQTGTGWKELASAASEALSGVELPNSLKVTQAWNAVNRQMLAAGTAIAVFDEFHHVFGIYDRAKRVQIGNGIKALTLPAVTKSQTLKLKFPIQIVLAGLPAIGEIIFLDSQNAIRHVDMEIKPLPQTASGRKEMQKFISLIEPELDFPAPCNLSTDDMSFRFMKATAGYTGRAMRFIKTAAYNAINVAAPNFGRKELGVVLQRAYGLSPRHNPFLVEDVSKCDIFRPIDTDIPTGVGGSDDE